MKELCVQCFLFCIFFQELCEKIVELEMCHFWHAKQLEILQNSIRLL
jgi:hypothetical protein